MDINIKVKLLYFTSCDCLTWYNGAIPTLVEVWWGQLAVYSSLDKSLQRRNVKITQS